MVLSSLQEEREKGYFDDSGNYVEKEDKDAEEDAKDAWLQSDEGVWVGGGWVGLSIRDPAIEQLVLPSRLPACLLSCPRHLFPSSCLSACSQGCECRRAAQDRRAGAGAGSC